MKDQSEVLLVGPKTIKSPEWNWTKLLALALATGVSHNNNEMSSIFKVFRSVDDFRPLGGTVRGEPTIVSPCFC